MNAQMEVQEFEIDAQVNWKHYYSIYMQATKYSYRRRFRAAMKQLRREAALERRIAEQQRTIEAQAQRIAELEGYIDKHNQHVLQQDVVNKFLFHNS